MRSRMLRPAHVTRVFADATVIYPRKAAHLPNGHSSLFNEIKRKTSVAVVTARTIVKSLTTSVKIVVAEIDVGSRRS
jgi:hypothetical protein